MQSIHDAARRLMIAGVVDDMPSGARVITDYARENDIEIDADGYVRDRDYDDIVHELKDLTPAEAAEKTRRRIERREWTRPASPLSEHAADRNRH